MPMNQPQQPQPVQLNIELPADLEAIYANFALISHSPSEVILDFARVLPGNPKTRVQARLVMTPLNAKSLHRALGENLEAFEKQHGSIRLPDEAPGADKGMGFTR
jgi:hypothetical protein